MSKRLGRIIKSLRIRQGLTQDDLAEKLKVRRSAVGNWEQGTRTPDMGQIEMIADIFNVDMNYFSERSTEEYYYDLKTKQIAQEILSNKELQALFDASRGASPEDLEITKNLLLSLKEKERKADGD
ncbi:MAG: helix-turn-helix transcriptional regulator [Desulfitobacterium sp.]